MKTRPVPGQRWLSETEPELGLGVLLEVEAGRVTVLFPAAEERRLYAFETAPLRRVRFAPGDRLALHDGTDALVEQVVEENGLLVYRTDRGPVPEIDLSDHLDLSTPLQRLLSGRTDSPWTFQLRRETLAWRSRIRSSPIRGFAGGRVDLIPHQLSIAGEVTGRLQPRVLLSDEVGLGKTIEAGLILHRLHLTGRANRVLILVPEPLVHQWFVELLRRFNLLFAIFDAERFASLVAGDASANPFLDSQLVLCSVAFLEADPAAAEAAIGGEWDLVIVDEAHHLQWSPEASSPAYQLVEAIASDAPGLLLLTATPQQLGSHGHFARLRLIDPDRYASLESFLEESAQYEQVAEAADRLLDGKSLTARQRRLFGSRSARLAGALDHLDDGKPGARKELVKLLVDEFGVGRTIFRNRRASIPGFPERTVAPAELPAGEPEEQTLRWLAGLLRRHPEEKVLLIGRSRELAERIHEALPRFIKIRSALFHEGLSLLNRDRNAAFFAEPDGARILICSEIGSEGRNFQFAHHLVLFDLPEDPDLLEQRIGRLDRIGQTETIRIHVPFQRRTRSEVLFRWYHDGLNAFVRTAQGASRVAEELRPQLEATLEEPESSAIDALVRNTRAFHATLAAQLAKGNDRLLELNSFNPELAGPLIEAISRADADERFEQFVVRLLDECGLDLEELARHRWRIRTGHLRADAFPALPEEGLSATFERKTALQRDDLAFLTIDHPIVRGAMDLFLGGDTGNANCVTWQTAGPPAIYLEALAVVECIAPAALHLDRFLPPMLLRVVVDHQLLDCTLDPALQQARLEPLDPRNLLERPGVRTDLLPEMWTACEALAAEQTKTVGARAAKKMNTQLTAEIERLRDLQSRNATVRPAEITALEKQRANLESALASARSRIEAIRLIARSPTA